MHANGNWQSRVNNVDTSNLNEFYTITSTYDNRVHSLYINGILVNSIDRGGNFIITTSRAPFGIGGNPSQSSMDWYNNVELENVLIYDRALTQEEVARNYQVDLIRY